MLSGLWCHIYLCRLFPVQVGPAAGGESGKAAILCVPSHSMGCGSVSTQRKERFFVFPTKVPHGLASGLDCP